jgi:ABC-type transport system substrate-binding protein
MLWWLQIHTRRPPMRTLLLTLALNVALPAAAQSAPPLLLAIGGESDTGFDPIIGWGRYGNPLFQATLLHFAADLNLIVDLATAWSLSDDRLTWTLTLREGARFADVAFTFNRAREQLTLARHQVRIEVSHAQSLPRYLQCASPHHRNDLGYQRRIRSNQTGTIAADSPNAARW